MLQEKVLNMDLFQTLRQDAGACYEMKGLLDILIKTPESVAILSQLFNIMRTLPNLKLTLQEWSKLSPSLT
jgi:hypothetical protein